MRVISGLGQTENGPRETDSQINNLPPSQEQLEIEGIECHFNWIKGAMSHLRPDDFSRIRKRNEAWIEETKDDPSMVYYKILTQHMIKALCAYLKGLYDDAKEYIKKALTDMRTTDAREGGFELGHYAAYDYIINANMLVLLHKLGDMSCPAVEPLKKHVLGQDCRYPPTAALLLVVKACYLRWFEVDCSQTQTILEEASFIPFTINY